MGGEVPPDPNQNPENDQNSDNPEQINPDPERDRNPEAQIP